MIDFGTETLLFMIPVAAVIAVIFAAYFFKYVWSKDKGTPEMQEISDAIETGAMAYLRRQYKTIGIISVIVAIVIALVGFASESFEDSRTTSTTGSPSRSSSERASRSCPDSSE